MIIKAFSLLTVKEVDEEKREIRGIATTPTPDRVGDIVEPLGALIRGDIKLHLYHKSELPVGSVKFGKPTKDGIPFTAIIPNVIEDGIVKDRVNEAWHSVKYKLLAAVSIGFRALRDGVELLKSGGLRYTNWEMLELSLISVPAQPEAVIQSFKSMDGGAIRASLGVLVGDDEERAALIQKLKSIDTEQRAASGNALSAGVRLLHPAGASAKAVKTTKPKPLEGKEMKTIAEQLAALVSTREEKSARMTDVMNKSLEAGRSTDAAEAEEFDTLELEVKQLDQDIVRLKRLEELNKAKATPVAGTGTLPAADSRANNTLVLKEKLAPGILFARHAMCVFAAKGNVSEAAQLARTHYGEESPVSKALSYAGGRSMETVMKAAVAAGNTIDATWAKPLVEYVNYAGDFVDYLRPRTLLGQFGVGSIPGLRRIPFNVHIKGQTVGGTGYWVGEGKPKPVTKFGYNDTYHGWYKVAAIAVLTDELIRFSDPSAETYVRDSLGDVLVERMDTDFINPAFAGAANVSPASILYGVTPIPSSGNDADAVRADIAALWAASDAAQHVFDTPVYVTRASVARALSSMRNALGQPEFPGMTPRGGMLDGVPVLVSNYVPADSGGSVFALVNASDIYFSDDGQATVDFSREASIQMLDNPTNASIDGTATTMVSMFQNDSIALRAHRFVNYSRRRATAVAYLDDVNWGAA